MCRQEECTINQPTTMTDKLMAVFTIVARSHVQLFSNSDEFLKIRLTAGSQLARTGNFESLDSLVNF